ncbi:hypothetical protein PQR57_17185 [Paraburkholderia dipogonis]|uniref:Uncharacterized protein n=1 Tax=Paraburkholderia dipogonis TaxID=1211383 RepID=A0ABW9AQ90_9BURK
MTWQGDVPGLTAKVAGELAAAAKALMQAHTLFSVIDALLGDEMSTYRAQVLARIGFEMTMNYGERAEEEAANLAEVARG